MKGPLPTGAVAWLDMGKGEASLVFNKKTDSNRAGKRLADELFKKVPPGYHPLYLHTEASELLALALAQSIVNAHAEQENDPLAAGMLMGCALHMAESIIAKSGVSP